MSSRTAPPLNIPNSSVAVTISAIDSTLWIDANTAHMMWNPIIKGFDKVLAGTWCFLIEHSSGRKLLYDLGCRKDWENLSPILGLQELIANGTVNELSVKRNMSEILMAGGLQLEQIEAIIWSHWHFDHTGDPSTFPNDTKLIVGKGFKDEFLPGYPSDPEGAILESDIKGRVIEEIDFNQSDVSIGRFKAFDYFGDGSFYILDSPGHALGHINALARTQVSPSASFIHLGGDSIHHPGEIRPSDFLSLPTAIEPSPLPRIHPKTCPGQLFSPILREGSSNKAILECQDPFKADGGNIKFSLIYDEPALRDTIRKDEELDAHEDVFTIIAHDWSMKGIIDEWPKNLNSWREKGWKKTTQWKFLEDFQEACIN